jgi:hypothetical protein
MNCRLLYLVFVGLFITGISACKKVENPNDEAEHETITTLSLIFKFNEAVVESFVFDDPDGSGGNPPVTIDSIKLEANKKYDVSVLLTNKTKNPPSDVTPAIIRLATSHEMFYLPEGVNITINRLDTDRLGFPLGLESTWESNQPDQEGQIRIKLMHKPIVKGPNDSPNLGHSDIDVTMPLVIF